MANEKIDMWEQVKQKIIANQGIQGTTIDDKPMTPVPDEHDSSVAVAEPPKTRRIEGASLQETWMSDFQSRDTEPIPAKTRVQKTKGLEVFDRSEQTLIKRTTEEIDRKQREKKELLSDIDLCPPYDKDSEKNYKKEVMRFMISLYQLSEAKEKGTSIDDIIREHVLETIDENIIPEKERINKMEEYLHKVMIGYFAFCSERINLLKDCESVPEQFRKALYQTAEDAYNLAFKTIAKSSILRNHDLIQRITKPEYRKLWDKNGELRKRATKVIDELSNAFKKYFGTASMDENSEYHRIMHPNGKQDSGMKEVLERLEQKTGLIRSASRITTYT